jgi:hypothetical protein
VNAEYSRPRLVEWRRVEGARGVREVMLGEDDLFLVSVAQTAPDLAWHEQLLA